eukprot:9192909-Pyramimonas_sp.AAC.1
MSHMTTVVVPQEVQRASGSPRIYSGSRLNCNLPSPPENPTRLHPTLRRTLIMDMSSYVGGL